MTIPKPTAVKKLEGNPGGRPLNENEPSYPAPSSLTAPDWLSEAAKEEWERLSPYLSMNGLITVADIQTFAAYCSAVDTFKQATKEVNENGILKTGYRGDEVKNPAFQIMRDSMDSMKKFSALFGFSPADRTRIATKPQTDAAKTLDSFMEEFND